MPVLEIGEIDKHSADKALVVCHDKSIMRFDQQLRAQQVKASTRATYLWQLARLKRELPKQVDLLDVAEAELLAAMSKIADEAKGTGYKLLATVTKRFYKVMGKKDLVEKIIVPRKFAKVPEILTSDEVKQLIDAAGGPDGSLRDRLVVELLWETGCRVGELCNLKIKDVQFDQYSAIIHLNGKTGERRVRAFVSKPDLREYLNNHPFKNNPQESLLLTSYGPGGHFHRLTDQGVRFILTKLSKRALKRHVNPHLLRHTRATELSPHVSDRVLKIWGGWKRTTMLEIYSHLSGKDVDDTFLALHGFKPKEEAIDSLSVRVCRQEGCNAENAPMAVYCQKCGHPLANGSTEDLLKDPKFIAGLAQNREFIDALKKALESG